MQRTENTESDVRRALRVVFLRLYAQRLGRRFRNDALRAHRDASYLFSAALNWPFVAIEVWASVATQGVWTRLESALGTLATKALYLVIFASSYALIAKWTASEFGDLVRSPEAARDYMASGQRFAASWAWKFYMVLWLFVTLTVAWRIANGVWWWPF